MIGVLQLVVVIIQSSLVVPCPLAVACLAEF